MVDALVPVSGIGNVLGYRVTPYTARNQPQTAHSVAFPLQGQVQNENIGAATLPVSTPTNQTGIQREKSKPPEENPEQGGSSSGQYEEMSEEEKKQVDELKSTDRRVRAHEQAHLTVGGSLVTQGAMYTFRTGPDGKRYAVAGEVQIDTSPVANDPQATVVKAGHIVRTALAPVDPSPQDRMVASQALSMQMKAQAELARQAYQAAGQLSQDTSLGFVTAG